MNELAGIFEQFRLFVVEQAPVGLMTHAAWTAIAVLVVGVAISVLGAKMARWGITCCFALIGAGIGVYFSRFAGFPATPCVLVSGAMLAIVGSLTHRLWVGVVASIVLSALVLGGFGYHRIAPHVCSFDPMVAWSAADGESSELLLPTPEQQEAYRDRTPQQWFQEFWSFVLEHDVDVPRNGKALALAAAIIGLFLGVFAVRYVLILSTSLIGTLLVTTAVAALGTQLFPGFYQSGFEHPGMVGMGVGGFLVSSLIVQTVLTRDTSSKQQDQPAGKS